MKYDIFLLKLFFYSLLLVFETLEMSMMTLSNHNNNFDGFISTYFQQGFTQSSLGELFHDLQPDEDIGHLQAMMKSVFFEKKIGYKR